MHIVGAFHKLFLAKLAINLLIFLYQSLSAQLLGYWLADFNQTLQWEVSCILSEFS